jgi:hypothetical protein
VDLPLSQSARARATLRSFVYNYDVMSALSYASLLRLKECMLACFTLSHDAFWPSWWNSTRRHSAKTPQDEPSETDEYGEPLPSGGSSSGEEAELIREYRRHSSLFVTGGREAVDMELVLAIVSMKEQWRTIKAAEFLQRRRATLVAEGRAIELQREIELEEQRRQRALADDAVERARSGEPHDVFSDTFDIRAARRYDLFLAHRCAAMAAAYLVSLARTCAATAADGDALSPRTK